MRLRVDEWDWKCMKIRVRGDEGARRWGYKKTRVQKELGIGVHGGGCMDRVVDTMGRHQLYLQHIGLFRLLKSELNEIYFQISTQTGKLTKHMTRGRFQICIYLFIRLLFFFCLAPFDISSSGLELPSISEIFNKPDLDLNFDDLYLPPVIHSTRPLLTPKHQPSGYNCRIKMATPDPGYESAGRYNNTQGSICWETWKRAALYFRLNQSGIN